MPLPDLDDPEHLHVIVFGPGRGEAVVVHAPPSTWLVVDSMGIGERNSVAELLVARDAPWSALVLTHSHTDHAAGFLDYLDLPGDGPVGCLLPPAVPANEQTNDRTTLLSTQLARKVQRRVDALWDARPETRWNFHEQLDPRRVGPLTVQPLWPHVIPDPPPDDLNEISTPLVVHWEQATILLAADLLNAQWSRLQTTAGSATLSTADPVKLAHHASVGAQHPLVIAGARERIAIATPYANSTLPRFDDAHGIAAVLEHTDELHLTSLRWSSDSVRLTRAQALALQEGTAADRRGRYSRVPLATAHPRECWQHVRIDRTGAVVSVVAGAGGHVITP